MFAPIVPTTTKLPLKVEMMIFLGLLGFFIIDVTSLLLLSMLFNLTTKTRLVTRRAMKPNTIYQNPATPFAGLNLQKTYLKVSQKPLFVKTLLLLVVF
jgi:hypothetical protein